MQWVMMDGHVVRDQHAGGVEHLAQDQSKSG